MVKKRVTKKNIGKCCLECSKFIDIHKDHYVQLSTHNREISPDDYAFFHFSCWVDYFNKRVENKMKANVRFMQERALQLFDNPMIKSLLEQVQGSELALNMLKTPINTDVLVSKEKVKKQIQNDRKQKRAGKKRKA